MLKRSPAFIHRILPTNTFLCRIGLVDDNKCTFCKKEEATMKHLMWSCEYVSKLWNDVYKWLTDLNIHVLNYNILGGMFWCI